MAHTFTPPVNSHFVPPILPESKGPEFMLFRHMESRPQAANVFLLSNGTVVQDIPTDIPVVLPQGSAPYPWNPDNPGGPYATWGDAAGVQQYISLSVYTVTVFYGGHGPYTITDAQYAQLNAAGYGACLT